VHCGWIIRSAYVSYRHNNQVSTKNRMVIPAGEASFDGENLLASAVAIACRPWLQNRSPQLSQARKN
jgi:hypothetical protein